MLILFLLTGILLNINAVESDKVENVGVTQKANYEQVSVQNSNADSSYSHANDNGDIGKDGATDHANTEKDSGDAGLKKFDWLFKFIRKNSIIPNFNPTIKIINDLIKSIDKDSINDILHRLAQLVKEVSDLIEVIKEKIKMHPDFKREIKETFDLLKNKLIELLEHRIKRYASKTDSNITKIVPLTKLSDDEVNSSNEADGSGSTSVSNSRRMLKYNIPERSLIKDKLLTYIREDFRQIQEKVKYLVSIKQTFASVLPYKIGYIAANVDTLAVNMMKLREEVEKNRNVWRERDIINVYDRLKVANSIVTNLLDVLRVYTASRG